MKDKLIFRSFNDEDYTTVVKWWSWWWGKEKAIEKLSRQIPMGKIGEPNDVAFAILYLASDESKFVTGTEIRIDGGISAL